MVWVSSYGEEETALRTWMIEKSQALRLFTGDTLADKLSDTMEINELISNFADFCWTEGKWA